MKYRDATLKDINAVKRLAIKVWSQFKSELTNDNWLQLKSSLEQDETYIDLLLKSYGIVCENENNEIIGMIYLVPSGNPTEIYLPTWAYIRFLTVSQEFSSKGIATTLIKMCIDKAKQNNEKTIALHTSEIMRKAISIYEKLGFTMHREIDKRLGKKYWLYKLEL